MTEEEGDFSEAVVDKLPDKKEFNGCGSVGDTAAAVVVNSSSEGFDEYENDDRPERCERDDREGDNRDEEQHDHGRNHQDENDEQEEREDNDEDIDEDDDHDDCGDDRYKVPPKRGRGSSGGFRGRNGSRGRGGGGGGRMDYMSPGGGGRSSPRGHPRFRGRGFGRGGPGMYRSGPPGHYNSRGGGGGGGGPRFRSGSQSNWENNWKSGNDMQDGGGGGRGPPSLMRMGQRSPPQHQGSYSSDRMRGNNRDGMSNDHRSGGYGSPYGGPQGPGGNMMGRGGMMGSGHRGSVMNSGSSMSGGPGMRGPMMRPPMGMQGVDQITKDSLISELQDSCTDIWVETKAGDGKSYFYNAKSRETTWIKPEGNVKILLQEQVDAMAATNQSNEAGNDGKVADGSMFGSNMMGGVQQSMAGMPVMSGMTPMMGGNPVMANTMQPPPGMMQPNMTPFGAPPFAGPPPFGMPPPGFPNTGFPGGFPGPWGVPQAMQMQPPPMMVPTQQMVPSPATNAGVSLASATSAAVTISAAPMQVGSAGDAIQEKIDPEILARAADWSEHKAPDGRSYYYNMKLGESVWEKPQPLKDLEAAKLAAMQGVIVTVSKPAIESGIQNTLGGILDKDLDLKEDSRVVDDVNHKQLFNEEDNTISETEIKSKDDSQDLKRDMELVNAIDEASSKKHEEEQKSKEIQKVQDRSKPVSSKPISGTPWCVVWTGDGRVFFYNPSTRTSVWERPEDLVGRADVTKLISSPPPDIVATITAATSGSPSVVITQQSTASSTVKRDSSSQENNDTSLAKRAKLDNNFDEFPAGKEEAAKSVSVSNGTVSTDKRQIDIGKEAAMEAEVRAARERAVVPLETRISQFREMLAEKEVSAFSTWEKELHKIVFDPRYLLLTSKERKQVFEKYVKERAEEERQEKRNRMKMRKEEYRKLMEEANLHGKSSFGEFATRYTKDERFKNVEKMRERESLFNEFILEVRKREKEEKSLRREQVRKEFFELLRDHTEIDRHSRWNDVKKRLDSDLRYKAVDSSTQREDYFRDYIRQLKDERREKKEREREHEHRDKDRKDKSAAKESKESKTAESEPEQASATSDAERDRESKEAEKAARVEASLREREKEVQRTLAVHLRDRDNEREQHKHDEAVLHFNALLADLVRNTDMSWRDTKKVLRKDSRWEHTQLLDRDEKEKLFNSHIEMLGKKKKEKFRELLDESSEVTLSCTWKEIKKHVKDDPRCSKFSSSDRKCEREFKDYIKDKLVMAKCSFRELLQETKLITHKSNCMVKENENYLQEIEEILKNDSRYLTLNHMPEERMQLIMSYLDDIEKRGPPPPPTASEPTRRSVK